MNQFRPARLRMIGVSVGFAMIATLGLNGPAHAEDLPSDTVTAIEQAVEDADQAPAAENDAVSLPSDSNDTTSLVSDAGTLEFDVPATGDIEETTDAGVLFDGADDDTSIAVESTDLGVRALIHIDSENAPERFEFPVSGDVPWAVDATGREVPTHYEIDGTTLIQIVEHRAGGFEYGIVADPDFICIARCAAAVGIFVAKNGHIAVKVARIIGSAAKLIKKLKKYKKAGKSRSASIKLIAYELADAKDLDEMITKCWP